MENCNHKAIRKAIVPEPEHFHRHQGLVGYFDILGFSHIASDNELGRTVALIRNDFLTIPEEIQKSLANNFGPRVPPDIILFADSILVWLDIPQAEARGLCRRHLWHYFLSACSSLMQKMFNRGLPLRGAISEGSFYIEDHCFVGKAITDCHKLQQQQEWAGCVIDPRAWTRFRMIDPRTAPPFKSIMEWVCVQYPVPLKTESKASEPDHCSDHQVIKWFPIHRGNDYIAPNPSLADLVKSAFTAHGKTLSPKESKKVDNTITELEYFESIYRNTNDQIPHNQTSV